LDEDHVRSSVSAAEWLRDTTAAVRVSFTWMGVRKTRTPEQKTQAAGEAWCHFWILSNPGFGQQSYLRGGVPMRVIVPVFTVLVLGGVVDAQDAIKKEMKQLEGEWSMMSGEANGFSMPKETVDRGKRVAKNGETTITIGGQVYFKAKISIDPSKKPKAIDYAMTEGPTKGKTHLGIYELDGDTVKFCFAAPGKDRPTEFTAKEGSERTLSVWKRDKK